MFNQNSGSKKIEPTLIFAAFKAATVAIDLAKKGVAFYKEIKATAGDVSDVLKDLKEQYHKIVNPSPDQKRQYNEEVKRVQSIASANPQDVLNSIWDNLGVFVDQYDIIMKAYIADEASAKKVYRGEESIARRALRRIQVRTQLDAMLAEVRQQMVWNTPSELGDVWTRFEAMWQQIVIEQNEALAEEMRKIQAVKWQREKAISQLKAKAVWIGAVVFVILWFAILMTQIHQGQMFRGFYSSPFLFCFLCS